MPNLLGKIPWIRRLFTKGANTDIRPELRSADQYDDAQNMRPDSVTGNALGLERIGGEVSRSRPEADEIDIAQTYTCIGACSVTSYEVSFWASISAEADPDGFPFIMKVNGATMVKTPLVPYKWNRPLQFGNVSDCQGGVIFPADHENEPLFWDIPAIVAAHNAGSDEYTTGFELSRVTVALASPLIWPLHTGNPNIGTGANPGQYFFRLRYVTSNGDKTNFSPPTPLITVPLTQAPIYFAGLNPPNYQYPGGQTTGGPPAGTDDTPTPYGIGLEWQVDNREGYPLVEVAVTRFNDGQGLAGPGITEVVARLSMTPNEFSLREFVYPRDNNFFEEIPVDEAQQEQLPIDRPKTVEYTDNRVIYGNFRLKDRITDIEYREVDGNRAVPITNHVFTRWNETDYEDGYSDPRNNTYFKSAQHNERYGLGLMLWDNTSSRAPVSEIVQSFQMPARRDRKAGDSLAFSYNQLSPFGQVIDPITAANSECQGDDPVSPTFDAIEQGSVRKSNDSYVNVEAAGPYLPWSPINPESGNFVRYRQMPISRWITNEAGDTIDETGHVFSPKHHALGTAIYGPQNLDEEAPWWKAFSIMRTPPANRVIAEGIGVYALRNNIGPRSKHNNALWCHFPDVDSSVVDESIWQDVRDNPTRYRVHLTPFGFKSEIYSYDETIGSNENVTHGVDLISYCDVQFDNGTSALNPQWSVNPGETAGAQGYQPTFSAPAEPTNYVGPDAWRYGPGPVYNSQINPLVVNNPDYSPFRDEANAAQGNFLFTLRALSYAAEGRGGYWGLATNETIYQLGATQSGSWFDNESTRRFHAPVYMVQIIRDANDVEEQNQQQWIETSTRVLREHTIGLGDPSTSQFDVDLMYARPEDCVPLPGSGANRYVYIREPGQQDKPFVCFTNSTGIDFAAAIAAFAAGTTYTMPDGTEVYGAYTYVFDNQSRPHIRHILRFNQYSSFVPAFARIVVKYDRSAPIQAFGFDRSINNAIFAPIDRVYGGDQPDQSTEFTDVPPLPYNGARRSFQYVLPTGLNFSPIPLTCRGIEGIRQWAVMAHIVCKTSYIAAIQSDSYPGEAFPRRHYVIRPVGANADQANPDVPINTTSGAANGFNSQYDADYPGEAEWFRWGGFQFRSNYNLDYARSPLVTGIGIPRDGQFSINDYCTGFAASDRDDPRQSDAPGLRTFRWDNVFVASKENGELKHMRLLNNNLTGLFERGMATVPVNKATLTDADGNLVATQSIANFWPRPGSEVWITRQAMGSPDQMWRIVAKYTAPNGAEYMRWADRNGVYRTDGRGIADISRNRRNRILIPLLQAFPADYSGRYAAVYDTLHAEDWMQVGGVQVRSEMTGEWVGSFTHDFDAYQCLMDGQVVGYKELSSWNLNSGEQIAGQPVEAWAQTHHFEPQGAYKEIMRFRAVGTEPDYVEVYDEGLNLICRMDEATNGPLWTKYYDGWEGFVGRVLASVDAQRPLPQGMGFYLRIGFNTFGAKEITISDAQIKRIK